MASDDRYMPLPNAQHQDQRAHHATELNRSMKVIILKDYPNVLAILFSLFVLVYAGLVRHYDRHLIDDSPHEFLDQIAKIGPSLFPVVFAAVIGKNLRGIALWELEKGQSIGALDQLLGSSTVVSAFVAQYRLRSLGPLGLGLLALWSLSPLGGQASLRVLDHGDDFRPAGMNVQYPTLDFTSEFVPGFTSARYSLSSKQTIFTAALTSPNPKDISVDLWGNIKVPFLEHIDSTVNKDGWKEMRGTPVYSALLGIPLSESDSSDFTVQARFSSSYWRVECQNFSKQSNFTHLGPDWYGPAISQSIGASSQLATGNGKGNGRKLLYESNRGNCQVGETDCIFQALCTYNSSHVEVEVRKSRDSFNVTRMRQIDREDPDDHFNLLGDRLWLFSKSFTTALASPNGLSNLQFYLDDPSNVWRSDNTTTIFQDIGGLEFQKRFATSMSQAMNTLWISLIADYLLVVGSSDDFAGRTDQIGNRTAELKVASDISLTHRVMICRIEWLIVLIVSTAAIFSFSVAGIVLSFYIRGPEINMNASTLVRLSQHAGDMNVSGTALSDDDRGRIYKHRKVVIGDVQPDNSIGRISIAALKGGDSVSVTRLQFKRLYS